MEALYALKEQLAKAERVMMNIAERKQTSAPADAQGWLAQFDAALQAQDAAAAAALFLRTGCGATSCSSLRQHRSWRARSRRRASPASFATWMP